jgi:hypothetical protein
MPLQREVQDMNVIGIHSLGAFREIIGYLSRMTGLLDDV